MRIITKFQDYYDAGLAQGEDSTLVFVRHTESWNLAQRQVPPATLTPLVQLFAEREPAYIQRTAPCKGVRELTVNFGLIWFAGRLYPLAGVSARRAEDVLFQAPEFCYSVAALTAAMERYDQPLHEKKKYRFLDPFDRPKPEAFFELDGSPLLQEVAVRDSLPVASLYGYDLRLNPRLRDYAFYRRLDAWQAFQELSMFLGNIAAPDRVPVHVADKDRIVQHGFDEWSFRKMPQGK